MLTVQETFTIAKDHLLKQGAKASEPGSSTCYYRRPDGKKCPVGALIQDAYYSPSLEGRGVSSLDVRLALRQSGVPVEVGAEKDKPVMVLLSLLQRIHDLRPVEEWESALRALAAEESLKYDYVVGAE